MTQNRFNSLSIPSTENSCHIDNKDIGKNNKEIMQYTYNYYFVLFLIRKYF